MSAPFSAFQKSGTISARSFAARARYAAASPRPIVSDEVKFYGAAYDIFASVHPGVTGLWQASGRSGTDYARRVALDTYYVLNWSPWMDVWVLFRTIGAVLFMRGAC